MIFQFYSLRSGAIVATDYFSTHDEALAHRLTLEARLKEPLSTLVPISPEADQIHIDNQVARYRAERCNL